MGLFDAIGGAVKDWAQESNESREDLRDELRRMGNSTVNMAKRNGYRKAAKERGIA